MTFVYELPSFSNNPTKIRISFSGNASQKYVLNKIMLFTLPYSTEFSLTQAEFIGDNEEPQPGLFLIDSPARLTSDLTNLYAPKYTHPHRFVVKTCSTRDGEDTCATGSTPAEWVFVSVDV